MRRPIVLATAIAVALLAVSGTAAIGKGQADQPVFINMANPGQPATAHFIAFDKSLCKQGATTLVSAVGWATGDGTYAFDATLLVTCDKGDDSFEVRLCGEGPPTAAEWTIVGGAGAYETLTGGGTQYNNQRDHKQPVTDFYLGEVSLDPDVDLTRDLNCPIPPE